MQKLTIFLVAIFMLVLASQGMAQREVLRATLPYSTGAKYAEIVTSGTGAGMDVPYNLMFTVVSTKIDTLQIYQAFQWASMLGFFKHKIYAPYLQETPLDEIIVDDAVYDETGATISGYYGAKFIAHTPFADGTWYVMKNDTIGWTSTDTLFIRAQRHLPN